MSRGVDQFPKHDLGCKTGADVSKNLAVRGLPIRVTSGGIPRWVPKSQKKLMWKKMLYTKITIGEIYPMTLPCKVQENSGLDVTSFTIR